MQSVTRDETTGVISVTANHWDGWNWSSTYDVIKFRQGRKYVDTITIDGIAFAFQPNYYASLNLFESGAVSATIPTSKMVN